jgi:pimeloyl-ACP methyl ester carboxylesterase
MHLQCGQVQVPLDWNQPGGRKISLSVIRYLARHPQQQIGSLFFNPGGPGVSGVAALRQAGAQLENLAGGRFNIVSWDPRGTGASMSVRCFDSGTSQAAFFASRPVPSASSAGNRYLDETITFARQCGRMSSAILAHISTMDTARDLNYLRQQVGEGRLTYLGQSYGTFLGATYANMFPRHVRAMVLDGVVEPVAYTSGDVAGLSRTMADTDLVLSKFEALCQSAGPGRCALAARGHVAAGVDQLLARLQRSPIPVRSATPPGQLTHGDALTALYSSVGTPAAWPQLARELDRAEDGDGSALLGQARAFYEAAPSTLPPAIAIGCADSPAHQSARAWPQVIGRFTGISRIYGPLLGWWLWAPCASWPVHSADRYTGPWNARTSNPILVIGTQFDPNTPFANARRLSDLLGNAVLLTHQGYGHVSAADPSACVEHAESSYLINLVAPPPGTVCASDRRPFDPGFGKPLP